MPDPTSSPPAAAQIGFRPLARDDFARLHGWLNDPEVARWYSSGRRTPSAIRRKYGPRIDGRSATRVYIVELGGRPAGLAQTYAIDAYPDFAAAVGAAAGWAGLDYLIGEPELRGKRLAHRVVAAFVDDVVAALPGIDVCASLPADDNLKSVRTLERAGFSAVRRVEVTPGQIDRLMIRELARGRTRTARRTCISSCSA